MIAPSSLLMTTFRAAVALKILGVLVGLASNQVILGRTLIERWWMALLTGIVLLIILLPRWTQARHTQLIVALTFALLAHSFDIIQTTHVPFEPLVAASPFGPSLVYTEYEGNNMHQLGAIFWAVPVVLACWQYEYRGLFALLGAGVLYALTPLLLPGDAFEWVYYTVQGFVVLGTTLILALTVAALSRAQRREQAQLQAAHQQLAAYTMTQEQLVVSRERNRIARELHDTLAHALSGTAIQLQAVQTLLPLDREAAGQELAAARTQIKQGLEESRRAIGALRASPVENLGIMGAVQERCDACAASTGARMVLTMNSPISHHLEQVVYRIVDEALTNVERHARPRVVRVTVDVLPAVLRLTIADDGVGFDVTANREGYGLLGMRERARLAGGTFQVASDESGTMITVEIPA